MYSTKNLPEAKGMPKTIQPGNVVARILSIGLEPGFNEGSYNIILNLETERPGDNFEGFLVDKDNPSGPRYKGQVGKVKLRRYSFDWSFKGEPVDRNDAMLKSLKSLAIALGKKEQLDEVLTETIEQYVKEANKVLTGNTYLNFCIAGKEYTREGYLRYELFLPTAVFKNPKKGVHKTEMPYESIPSSEESQLMVFDPIRHIIKKKNTEVNSFGPSPKGSSYSQQSAVSTNSSGYLDLDLE